MILLPFGVLSSKFPMPKPLRKPSGSVEALIRWLASAIRYRGNHHQHPDLPEHRPAGSPAARSWNLKPFLLGEKGFEQPRRPQRGQHKESLIGGACCRALCRFPWAKFGVPTGLSPMTVNLMPPAAAPDLRRTSGAPSRPPGGNTPTSPDGSCVTGYAEYLVDRQPATGSRP